MSGPRFKIPSTNTLLAFEAVARLGSVGRAAEERSTSQSAISRHLSNLEDALGVMLFERSGRGIALTRSGEKYFLAVQSSMAALHDTVHELHARKTGLTIGCTLEISGLVMLPIFSRLKRTLGDGVAARIVVYDYDMLHMLIPAGLDIMFETSVGVAHPDEDAVKVLDEEIVPVASPAFLERYEPVLAGPPRHWSGVPRLDIGLRTPGWATWDTWFDAHGCAPPDAPVETFENYIHLLRAAADGDGIALGWNGFMTDYTEAGQLVAVRDEWLRTGLSMYGVPTPGGKRNHATRDCLRELGRLIGEICSRRPVAV
ncbi:MAG: LysR family transcriptional regulator [Rhodospirillales bacterium]|nr:LysR family transcriptional regulator [Rhodospirillales bacterium]